MQLNFNKYPGHPALDPMLGSSLDQICMLGATTKNVTITISTGTVVRQDAFPYAYMVTFLLDGTRNVSWTDYMYTTIIRLHNIKEMIKDPTCAILYLQSKDLPSINFAKCILDGVVPSFLLPLTKKSFLDA